jgi:hypothetical protein
MDVFKKRILNPQKIAIYEYWGVILRDGNHLGLSPLGWELAQRVEREIPVAPYATVGLCYCGRKALRRPAIWLP